MWFVVKKNVSLLDLRYEDTEGEGETEHGSEDFKRRLLRIETFKCPYCRHALWKRDVLENKGGCSSVPD